MAAVAFTTEQRAWLAAEWDRLGKEPAPASPRRYGCLTAIGGLAVLLFASVLPKWVAWAAGAVVVAGLAVTLLFGSGVWGRAVARSEEAIAWLAQHGSGEPGEEHMRRAVALLWYAFVSEGPSTSTSFKFDEARAKLGAALPFVLEVERILRIERNIYPVFTDSKVHLPG